MEKIRDILIAAIVLVVALKLPSCYSGDGPEKDEAVADKWAYIAEVQQEYYDYGYSDAQRYTDELHRQVNKYYNEDFIALESLYEILGEEYGEKKADEIYDTIMNNSLRRILSPADLVNDFLGEPDTTND